MVRYKEQLVAQGCSQNLVLICAKTYSLVLDATPMGYVYACYFTYSHNVTMVDYKQHVYSHVVAQWFHKGIWNKP